MAVSPDPNPQDAVEARFEASFELAPHGLGLVAPGGRWLRVNKSLCNLLGYTEAEMLASDFLTVTHPDDRGIGLEYRRQLYRGEADSFQIEKRYMHKDGHAVPVVVAVSVVRWPDGSPRYFISQVQSVSAQMLVQTALRHSDELFRSAFNSAIHGMACITRTGQRLTANPAFCEMVGYTEAELLSPDCPPVTPLEDLPQIRRELDDVFTGVSPGDTRERRYLRKDGRVVWALRGLTVIHGTDGSPAYLLVQTIDITARKAAEEHLRLSQKMEAVGHLAGGIAHEFNNLLAAILGFADFLIHDLPPDSAERRFAQRIQSSAERGRALVQQLQMAARNSHMQRQPTDLVPIVTGTYDLLQATLPASTIVHLDAASRPLIARVNRTQIVQAVVNLCNNASDALKGQAGAVTVSIARAPVSPHPTPPVGTGAMEQGKDYAVLTVSDNGSGIAPEMLAQIFDPFFTTKPRDRGTGLGLAVVQGVAAECGGFCEASSEPGRGSMFRLYLPLTAEPPAPT